LKYLDYKLNKWDHFGDPNYHRVHQFFFQKEYEYLKKLDQKRKEVRLKLKGYK
jgi:hypothetical protein